jgi:Zn-dependent protease with chaperone function
MYAVQTVLHSAIASLLVDGALLAWNVKSPQVRQIFRFMVMVLSLASFPIYQVLSPRRGDLYFRLESLLDSNRWFFLDLWGNIPLFTLFLVVLGVTTVIFVIQELVPMVLQLLQQVRGGGEVVADEADETAVQKVAQALEGLPFDEKYVEILDDDDLALFSSTGLNPRIYVSAGLIRSFSADHLQVAFAHEIGHIRRSRKPVLIFAYVLRVLMFFNPVAMIEFRRLAQEEEKVCDDIAVALTGKAEALSEAIEMLRPAPEDYEKETSSGRAGSVASSIERYSHDLLLRSRMLRLKERISNDALWGLPYVITVALIVGINYFVV